MSKKEELTGIDQLRRMVKNFDACNEGFNTRHTREELIKIHDAWMKSGWDIYPDQWARRQVKDALRGVVPQWDDHERPTVDSTEVNNDGLTYPEWCAAANIQPCRSMLDAWDADHDPAVYYCEPATHKLSPYRG